MEQIGSKNKSILCIFSNVQGYYLKIITICWIPAIQRCNSCMQVKLKWLFDSDNCEVIYPYTLDKTSMQLDVFHSVHPIFFVIFFPCFCCLGRWKVIFDLSCNYQVSISKFMECTSVCPFFNPLPMNQFIYGCLLTWRRYSDHFKLSRLEFV